MASGWLFWDPDPQIPKKSRWQNPNKLFQEIMGFKIPGNGIILHGIGFPRKKPLLVPKFTTLTLVFDIFCPKRKEKLVNDFPGTLS